MSSLNNNKKRVSIRTKIFIGVGLFVILNIIINMFIIKISINDIYLWIEKDKLNKEFTLIKNNIKNDTELSNIIYDANDNGLKVKILDKNYNALYTIFNDRMNESFNNLDRSLLEDLDNNETKITTHENFKSSGYDLHLIGKIGDNYVIISSSIDSIKKDASTTTIVILLTSILTFFILTIVAYLISEIFSNKINEVKEVTEDISNLKFDKKLQITANDEIGDLLGNINDMSGKLEESIMSLKQANKKLKEDLIEKEKQEKVRKQLIANISHEFKTPLTIISGYSQLLLDDVKGKENKENIRIMISESERLSDLVHEFLELSRLESDNITINKTSVDMKELINNELKKLSVKINDKKIKINTKYCNDNIINADLKLITRVVENILTNAVKFCKNDMIINVNTYIENEYFVYDVYNSGDNIKSDDIENIFSSYYKDKSERNKEGTGLGLTIVNAIVSLHNGKCMCKNEKDGVRFIVKISK